MKVSRGDTYFIHYPNSPKEHLFVIITPVEEKTGSFLMVGVESAEDRNSEKLVFLFPGDFPFIKKKTSVAYRFATILTVSKLDEFLKSQWARPDEPMIGLAKSAVQVVAPALASLLLTVSGLHLVMSIDLLSLLPGLVAVLLVFLPRAERTQTGMAAAGNFWHEFRFGFRYIFAHPGLSGILLIFCGINLFAGFTYMV